MQDTIRVIVDTLFVSSKFNQENNHADAILILGMPIPLFSVLVAFLTFILSVGVNWYNKKKARQEGLIVIKNTILNWVGLINQSINEKVCRMSDFSSRVSKSDALQPEFFDYNKIMADKLSTFSLKEYTDSFVLNLKGDESINARHLFKIVSSLEFLNDVEKDLMLKYDNYRNLVIELIDHWNDYYFRLYKIRFRLQIEYGGPTSAGFPLSPEFISILDSNNDVDGRFSIKVFRSSKIEPLLAMINKEANTRYTIEIYEILTELKLILIKWDANNKGISLLFKAYSEYIESVYKDLSDSCDHLKEKGLKPWYKIN